MKLHVALAVGFSILSVLTAKHHDKPLILTPYIERGEIDHARELASVDKKMFLGYESYSGFFTVNKKYGNNLFFWYFPASDCEDMNGVPLIIWLQGGPGYTSLKGVFELIGPIRIQNSELKEREINWSGNYSLLFIDNPVGAGFSYTERKDGYPDNEDDVGDQLYSFLKQFLQMFPNKKKSPVYIAGQSYAGKYVPSLALKIHRGQKYHKINLKGISIGNGLIDMRSILPHYHQLCHFLGLLDDQEIEKLKRIEEKGIQYLNNNEMIKASIAFNKTIEYIKKHSGINVYNYLKENDNNSHPPEFEYFVQRPDVRRALHVGQTEFNLNNQWTYEMMLPDISNSTKPFIEELLEHYAVLCYDGQLDVILAHGLLKYTYNSFRWSRRDEYMKAQRKMLRRPDNGNIAAYIKKGGSFYVVTVRGAGHDVPGEQPEVARWLIDMFIAETINN